MKRRHLVKRPLLKSSAPNLSFFFNKGLATKSIIFQFLQTNSKSSMALEIVGRHALYFRKVWWLLLYTPRRRSLTGTATGTMFFTSPHLFSSTSTYEASGYEAPPSEKQPRFGIGPWSHALTWFTSGISISFAWWER